MVTCGLTACTSGSAPGQTLGIEYGKPLPLPLRTCCTEISIRCRVAVDSRNDTLRQLRPIYRFMTVICFVLGCSATTSPKRIEIQATLLRFVGDLLRTSGRALVIDLLWILLYGLLYNKFTTNRTSGV